MKALSETEWQVYHVALEAARDGVASLKVVSGLLPDISPQTVQRTRHRLITGGVLSRPTRFKRKPRAKLPKPIGLDNADEIALAIEMTQRIHVLPRIALKRADLSILLIEKPDATDIMASVEGVDGRTVSRNIVEAWGRIFATA